MGITNNTISRYTPPKKSWSVSHQFVQTALVETFMGKGNQVTNYIPIIGFIPHIALSSR